MLLIKQQIFNKIITAEKDDINISIVNKYGWIQNLSIQKDFKHTERFKRIKCFDKQKFIDKRVKQNSLTCI